MDSGRLLRLQVGAACCVVVRKALSASKRFPTSRSKLRPPPSGSKRPQSTVRLANRPFEIPSHGPVPRVIAFMHPPGASLALLALATLAASALALDHASDWPCFQGPLGTSASPETGLLREWPADGPPVLWRAKIGQGWGQPAIIGDSVYLCWTSNLHGTEEVAACLSAKDGTERWRQAYETPPYWKRNIGWAKGGIRATPCVSEGRVFTLGPGGHLHCFDATTGRPVWDQDLFTRWTFSGEKGFSFSPIVVDGKLILWYGDNACAQDDPEKVPQAICEAMEPATGKILWTYREPHLPGSLKGEGQTPAVTTIFGEHALIIGANCQLKALRIRDGQEIWKFDCMKPTMRGTSPTTPLVVGHRIVNTPDCDWMHVVAFDRDTPGAEGKILWRKDQATYTAVHQFVEQDGFLYGFTGHQPGDSDVIASGAHLALTCIDLETGAQRWKEPNFRTGTSALVADGLLFVRCYQTLRLVEATPEGYHQRGEVHTHEVWKPTVNITDIVAPALSHGHLYVRTPEELICYDVARH